MNKKREREASQAHQDAHLSSSLLSFLSLLSLFATTADRAFKGREEWREKEREREVSLIFV